MKNISGTPWYIEYLRTPGHRSKRDCRYYADGNCMKLNGICQGVSFCKGIGFSDKHKKSADSTSNKREKKEVQKGLVQCSFCRKYMTPEELKTHWKTCDWQHSRNPVKKGYETIECPYCRQILKKNTLKKTYK